MATTCWHCDVEFPAGHLHITQRQLAVLRLHALGCTSKDVAKTLSISPHTVKQHKTSYLDALEIPSTTRAIARLWPYLDLQPLVDQSVLSRLTSNQLQLLRFMALGYRQETIAKRLKRNVQTIKNTLRILYRYIGVSRYGSGTSTRAVALLWPYLNIKLPKRCPFHLPVIRMVT